MATSASSHVLYRTIYMLTTMIHPRKQAASSSNMLQVYSSIFLRIISSTHGSIGPSACLAESGNESLFIVGAFILKVKSSRPLVIGIVERNRSIAHCHCLSIIPKLTNWLLLDVRQSREPCRVVGHMLFGLLSLARLTLLTPICKHL